MTKKPDTKGQPSPIAKFGSLKLPNGKSFEEARHVDFKRAIADLEPKLLAAHETLLEFAIVVTDPDAEAMATHEALQADYDALQPFLQSMKLYRKWRWAK